MWDKFTTGPDAIAWLAYGDEPDDEPLYCEIHRGMALRGKLLPVYAGELPFICSTCWMTLSIKMLQTPDPGPDAPVDLTNVPLIGEIEVPDFVPSNFPPMSEGINSAH